MNAVTVPYKYIEPGVIIELGALLMNDIKSPADCKNDLRTTRLYFAQLGIDADFYLRWLANQGISCDCDVIMDIALPLYEHVHYGGMEPGFLNSMFLPEQNVH